MSASAVKAKTQIELAHSLSSICPAAGGLGTFLAACSRCDIWVGVAKRCIHAHVAYSPYQRRFDPFGVEVAKDSAATESPGWFGAVASGRSDSLIEYKWSWAANLPPDDQRSLSVRGGTS